MWDDTIENENSIKISLDIVEEAIFIWGKI